MTFDRYAFLDKNTPPERVNEAGLVSAPEDEYMGDGAILRMPLRRTKRSSRRSNRIDNSQGVQHQVEVALHRTRHAGVVLIERDRDLRTVPGSPGYVVHVGEEKRRAIRVEVAEELAAVHLDLRVVSDEQRVVDSVINRQH